MAKTVSKKMAPAPKVSGETKKKRKGTETYNSYIFKVLKQVHPQTRISKRGIQIVNNFVTDTTSPRSSRRTSPNVILTGRFSIS